MPSSCYYSINQFQNCREIVWLTDEFTEIGESFMHLTLIKLLVGVILFTPVVRGQDSLDVDTILQEIRSVDQQSALSGYFYQLEFTRYKKNFFGKNKLVKKFEAVLPLQIPRHQVFQHPLLLVYDSSRPVTVLEIIKSRDRIVRNLERMEKPVASQTAASEEITRKESVNRGYISLGADKNTVGKQPLSLDISKLLQNSTYSNPQKLEIAGREVISIDFSPLPNKKLKNSLFYLALIEGTILIDARDRQIIEIEGFPINRSEQYKDLPSEAKESFRVFYYQHIKVDNKYWFPHRATLDFMMFSEEFNGLDVKIEFIFSNYKRFDTEIRSVEIDPAEEDQKAGN